MEKPSSSTSYSVTDAHTTVAFCIPSEMKAPDESTAREWLKLSGLLKDQVDASETPLELLVELYPETKNVICYGPNGVDVAKFHSFIPRMIKKNDWSLNKTFEEMSQYLDLRITPALQKDLGFVKYNLNILTEKSPGQTWIMRYVFIRVLSLLALHGRSTLTPSAAAEYDDMAVTCLKMLKLNPYSFLKDAI